MSNDEIAKRLKDASESCIKHYEAWRVAQKSGETREALREAIHELRKVGARLEIEMAVSERDEMAAKPIPIPPHRSSRRQHKDHSSDDSDDNKGNVDPSGQSHGGGQRKPGGQQRRRRTGSDGQSE